MAYCFMDWETRSALDLTIVGGARYAKHPTTLPLMLSWAIDDNFCENQGSNTVRDHFEQDERKRKGG